MAEAIRAYWDYARVRNREGLTPVSPPNELLYAWRVNIDDLRPWEYDQMSAWKYDKIRHAKDVWERAVKDKPMDKSGEQFTQPLSEDYGPQFIDEPVEIPTFVK